MTDAEPTYLSCIFRHNTGKALNQGDGVYLNGSRAHFVDALLSGNTAKNWGAVHVEDQTPARFFNSRFVTNRAGEGSALS